MEIYIDAIWFLNVVFDSLLLVWSALLLKEKVNWVRIFGGGLAGSLIIWLYITPFAHLADQIWLKGCFSLLMVFIAFGFRAPGIFLKRVLTLYAITFMSGGILLGCYYFFNFKAAGYLNGFASGPGSFGDPISWIFVMIGFPLAWHFTRKHIQVLELANWSDKQSVELRILLNGLSIEAKGLVDTGNQLMDPLTGSPVCIISIHGKEKLLPKEIVEMIEKGVNKMNLEDEKLPNGWQEKMRIIPCRVVGEDNQLLIGFKPDALYINVSGEYKETSKCVISFTKQQLSSDGNFDAIIHPKLVPVSSAVHAS
ncbi:sigma-E processing peptidase SpoIIGA [Pradoshia sp.]